MTPIKIGDLVTLKKNQRASKWFLDIVTPERTGDFIIYHYVRETLSVYNDQEDRIFLCVGEDNTIWGLDYFILLKNNKYLKCPAKVLVKIELE
jgi:hypothetical protein